MAQMVPHQAQTVRRPDLNGALLAKVSSTIESPRYDFEIRRLSIC